MHSQNPDTTGMRDLPPLREPAPPPLPKWHNHQSGPKHLEEVEAYANRLRLYEDSKAAYEAELAKRRSAPMNRPATVGDRVAALHFKKTGWVPCEEMAAWLETAPSIPRNEPTEMWPADLNGPTPDPVRTQLGPKSASVGEDDENTDMTTDPIATLTAGIEALRVTVAQCVHHERPLSLTIDGERLAAAVAPPMDKAKVDPIEALIKEWTLATSPRENGGWIAKGWRNGHCYSESRDTLAEAVTGVVAQLKAATSEPEAVAPAKPSGYIITGDPKGTTTVMCSMTVTGDTVLITAPTPDDMQALTMACYNAEHHASIIIDGKNPPIFARIVTVECKHLDGLNTAECILTLKRSTAL